MGGRSTTNILLGIIAACLLFGGASVLGSLKIAFWIALALGVLVLIGWGIRSCFRSLAKEMRKSTTTREKALTLVSYTFMIALGLAWIRIIGYMLEVGNWDYRTAILRTMLDPWGIPFVMILICGATWYAGAAIGKIAKGIFRGESAGLWIDGAGAVGSAVIMLPFFLPVRSWQRAKASGVEPISASLVAFMGGLFVWLLIFGTATIVVLATMQGKFVW
jgi:hypothetical protein